MRSVQAWLVVVAMMVATQVNAAAEPSNQRLLEFPIPAAKLPRDPWPHTEGGVYFSMAVDDRIVRFDVSSREFRDWALPAGARPHGVAVADDGTIYYAGFGDGSIGEVDPRTGQVRQHRLQRADGQPYSLTFDARGNVWVTQRAGAIAVLDRATRRVAEFAMDGEPYGLAFDRNGILWVTCIGGDKLRAFDPRRGGVKHVIEFERGAKPRRLATGADGRIWVSLYGTGQLVAVDSDSGKITKRYQTPGGSNAGPYSVNVDPRGRVWVTEFQTDSIVVLDPGSGKFSVVRIDPRSGVRNAAFDAAGRYWYIGSGSGRIGLIR